MSTPPVPEPVSRSQILFYQSEDGSSRIEVRLDEGTVWLTQALIAELYQTSIPNINIHIRNIFKEGECTSASTVKEYLIVQTEGARSVQRSIDYYNLDMILAIGYRVRSHRGTQFRRWATQTGVNRYTVRKILPGRWRAEPGELITVTSGTEVS